MSSWGKGSKPTIIIHWALVVIDSEDGSAVVRFDPVPPVLELTPWSSLEGR